MRPGEPGSTVGARKRGGAHAGLVPDEVEAGKGHDLVWKCWFRSYEKSVCPSLARHCGKQAE